MPVLTVLLIGSVVFLANYFQSGCQDDRQVPVQVCTQSADGKSYTCETRLKWGHYSACLFPMKH
jgi:hypothetical protein